MAHHHVFFQPRRGFARKADREADLQIFSVGNPEISQSYNLVSRGTANQIRDRIVTALNWSEEFYKNEASSVLLKLLMGLVWLRDNRELPFDLHRVLDVISNPRELQAIANSIESGNLKLREQIESLSVYLSKPDNFKSLQGLRSQLESLVLSDFGELLRAGGKGIDLFQSLKEQKIIFILLDSRSYGESSKALGKLILQDLKAASAKVDNEIDREDRKPFTVIIDEFADMATEDFIGFLDRARSSRIGVVVAHQEVADLDRISPEFKKRLMNSTSTLFSFLQKLPESSELVSAIAGTRKVKEITEQIKSGILFDSATGMKSQKEVDEFIIHPNIVRSLEVGECVMVSKYPVSRAVVVKVRSGPLDQPAAERGPN